MTIELSIGQLLGIAWVTFIFGLMWWGDRHPRHDGYGEDSAEVDGIVFPDEPRDIW
jgi:hypothetical protein